MSDDDAKQLANEFGAKYMSVSARLNLHVSDLFETIVSFLFVCFIIDC